MRKITVPEEGIETLFGSYDENLKHLEALFNVRIRTQGHDLLVEGESPALDKVDRVVGQLASLMKDGFRLSHSDVKTASDLVAQDALVDLRDHFLKGSLTPAGKRQVKPKTVIAALGTGEALRCWMLVPTSPARNPTPDQLSAPSEPEWLRGSLDDNEDSLFGNPEEETAEVMAQASK